jgi:hypothetical protein
MKVQYNVLPVPLYFEGITKRIYSILYFVLTLYAKARGTQGSSFYCRSTLRSFESL